MAVIVEPGYTEKTWSATVTCSDCESAFTVNEDDLTVRYGCDGYYGHCDTWSTVVCPSCGKNKHVSPPKVIEKRLWAENKQTEPNMYFTTYTLLAFLVVIFILAALAT